MFKLELEENEVSFLKSLIREDLDSIIEEPLFHDEDIEELVVVPIKLYWKLKDISE